ncbi:multidrug efflux SMR transporter [Chitinophaga sp.]|uniref:DMT family transporter n=1 Tax=Chitinophaga sp. TaxID=1869181 RepID=UPI0031D702F2
MNWIILILAGLLETAFTFCLGKVQAASGSAAYDWYAALVIAMAFSLGLLMKAAQTIPIGTAYTVWTGIGTVCTVLVGIFIFKDPVNIWRIIFITLLIGSIIGLKVVAE